MSNSAMHARSPSEPMFAIRHRSPKAAWMNFALSVARTISGIGSTLLRTRLLFRFFPEKHGNVSHLHDERTARLLCYLGNELVFLLLEIRKLHFHESVER